MVEELSKMNFDQFKQNLNWDAIFGDLSHQSARAIKENIDSLKAAFEVEKGNMGIDEIKTVTEALTKLDDELNKRNPWRAMVQSIKAMKVAAKELPKLTEKHTQAQKDLNEATAEYKRITEELKTLQQQLSNPDLTDEQRADIQAKITEKLKEQGAALANVTEKEKKATQAQKELNDETERGTKAHDSFAEGLKDIGSVISQAGKAFSQLAGAMGESGEKLAAWGDTLSAIGEQASQTAANWGNKSAVISQAISGTISMVSNVIASRKKAKQQEEEWAKSQRAFVENMKLARIEEERTKTKDNEAFGVRDYVSEARDAVKAYEDAQNELYSKIEELAEKGKAKKGMRDGIDWGTVGKNTATGAAVGAAIGSIIPGVGTAIVGAIGAGIGAISGFVSGLFSKKKKNIWGGLLDQYPELIEKAADGEERINTELADQLIQQGILNNETKELVEEAKKWQEETDAAKQQLEEIAESLLGSLGSNLQNALVDAFVAGNDAAEALHKTVESTLEDMIKNLLYGARIAPILQKIKKQAAEALGSGGGAVEVMNVIKQNYGELETASQQFYDDIGYMKKEAAKSGFDIFSGNEERNAVSGGIANVTQDTAEEMNGRLTQIQSHTFSINENMKIMVSMQTTQLAILQGIHTDTGQLHAIRADIASVKEIIADFQIRGLKLK
jgi:DNA repair exonuclease SbcCD ATPase subunit